MDAPRSYGADRLHILGQIEDLLFASSRRRRSVDIVTAEQRTACFFSISTASCVNGVVAKR